MTGQEKLWFRPNLSDLIARERERRWGRQWYAPRIVISHVIKWADLEIICTNDYSKDETEWSQARRSSFRSEGCWKSCPARFPELAPRINAARFLLPEIDWLPGKNWVFTVLFSCSIAWFTCIKPREEVAISRQKTSTIWDNFHSRQTGRRTDGQAYLQTSSYA